MYMQSFVCVVFFSVSWVNVAFSVYLRHCRGWSGGAVVLGELPVPGRPTNLD